MKKLLFTQKSDYPHWVGDGFPVRSLFSYNDLGKDISPFLLLDYAGPTEFPPTNHIRGVGEHPHRGFETVTIVYSGEVEHRDSSGGGGIIKPGDVQWMTAASGLVHEEKHGKEFSKTGGAFEMVQLWVNLPKKFKMSRPRYQGIKNENIPLVSLPNEAGTLRVIAGEYLGHKGPASTFSPINLWDIRMGAGHTTEFKVPAGHTTAVFVLSGQVTLADGKKIGEAEIGILSKEETNFTITANEDAKILFMGGEPIQEPIFGYGPFVMNSMQEIHQAFQDFQDGKMGSLGRIEGAE
ncbi:pirin family protein [Peredibacter sp. HCB2-198]|uniref:pirin family protein n=1 Tax=Peredibacter sp. HCB2-198 TaxID=3383025 RepID=UPI0038B6293C